MPDDFAGGDNDLVILGNPGGDETTLDWLQQFASKRNFPPVIVFGDGDERGIVQALKMGAADYVSAATLTHELLVEICEAALELHDSAQESSNSTITRGLDIPGLKGYQIERCISPFHFCYFTIA